MTALFLITLTMLTIAIGALLIWANQLEKKIDKLEKKISNMQYQMEDILCDINIANRNILNAYSMLIQIKNEGGRNDGNLR